MRKDFSPSCITVLRNTSVAGRHCWRLKVVVLEERSILLLLGRGPIDCTAGYGIGVIHPTQLVYVRILYCIGTVLFLACPRKREVHRIGRVSYLSVVRQARE